MRVLGASVFLPFSLALGLSTRILFGFELEPDPLEPLEPLELEEELDPLLELELDPPLLLPLDYLELLLLLELELDPLLPLELELLEEGGGGMASFLLPATMSKLFSVRIIADNIASLPSTLFNFS